MKEDTDSLLPLLILPGIHFVLCLATDVFIRDEGFKWFMIGIIDFPVFLGVAALGITLTPVVEYTILGTLWWFSIGAVYSFFYKKIVES